MVNDIFGGSMRPWESVTANRMVRRGGGGERPAGIRSRTGEFALSEDLALNLGLLFRTLAPMRSRDNMPACGQGIDAMGGEEAAYWLGMAMHRRNPRRVLAALRLLLTHA